MPECTSCGTEIDEDFDYCPNCGADVQECSSEDDEMAKRRVGNHPGGMQVMFLLAILVAIASAFLTLNRMAPFSDGNSSEAESEDIGVLDTEIRYATEVVPIRRGPGQEHEVIEKLNPHESADILPDSSQSYWQAIYSHSGDSIRGYVPGGLLSPTHPQSNRGSSDKFDRYDRPEQSNWDSSVQTVEDYLENTLHDPDSYEPVEWYKLTRTQYREESYWAVRHKYRARNRFGGLVLKDEIFLIKEKGDVAEVIPYQE